jgi:CsoR family transcriptional regulator, copper-sensing transcriptional repressor
MTDETASPRGGYAAAKDPLLRRMARIEGQVRGVSRMIDEERYCIDVLQQISAVRAALDKVALALVADHVKHCVLGAEADNRDEMAEELLSALGRLVGSR